MESLGSSSGALPWGVWFSSWHVVSIDTGHIAQSPQSSPRWSPIFKIEPVLFPPSTSWQIDEKTMETMREFVFWGAPKSLQMMTAAMKLKDACSLEGKL